MVTSRTPPNRQSSIGAVIHDVAELVELQCKLIALNSREAKQSAVTAAAMAGVALVLFAVACLFTFGSRSPGSLRVHRSSDVECLCHGRYLMLDTGSGTWSVGIHFHKALLSGMGRLKAGAK